MKTELTIVCDAGPLQLFTELFKRALQVSQRTLDLGDFAFELARVESSCSPASTGELAVCLYPSDAFLRFAATFLARDFDLGTIKQSSHLDVSVTPNARSKRRRPKTFGLAQKQRAGVRLTELLGGGAHLLAMPPDEVKMPEPQVL